MKLRLVLSFGVLALSLGAQERFEQYAVILSSPPAAKSLSPARSRKEELKSAAFETRLRQIRAEQEVVKLRLAADGGKVVGATDTVLNAVIVWAKPSQAEAWKSQPDVDSVRKMPLFKMRMNRALDLVNAPAAWQVLGGRSAAGQGTLIGIIDSGIDQSQPALQDSTLTVPSGYPRCNGTDCAFTNNKVIVARSYISTLLLPSDFNQPFPDDLSPRDRAGHGTAVAFAAAGNTVQAPVGTVSGVAPKAFLANYKVFGSPGVYGYFRGNTQTAGGTLMMALDDAVKDGVDVANLSLGSPAFYGPLDACGSLGNIACDSFAVAVENAIAAGMQVVVSAGNDGDIAQNPPALGSIGSPGTAPDAITVGATTNSRALYASLSAPSGPSTLQLVDALFGTGPIPKSPLSAQVVDVANLDGGSGTGCVALPVNSLTGKFALIQRGTCNRDIKVANAQAAGAIAVILYQFENSDQVFTARDLVGTGIPTVVIGFTSGTALKRYVASNPTGIVTLNPTVREVPTEADDVAYFSSRGPSIGDSLIKPELVAPGVNIFLATQTYDPNGDVYQDASGYTVADGTSFSAPIVSGAVALLFQAHPNVNYRGHPGWLKSAVVNTADNGAVFELDASGNRLPAKVTSAGAGKLNVARAINANVAVEPATLSYGVVTGAPSSITLTLSNLSSGSLTLNLSLQQTTPDSKATMKLSSSSVKISAGASSQISVSLSGNQPLPGAYQGALVITGGAETLRVPYLYLVGDRVPANMYPLEGDAEVGVGPNQPWPPGNYVTAKIVDQYGVAVPNAPVNFAVTSGGAKIVQVVSPTNDLGWAYAQANTGPTIGDQVITATSGNTKYDFTITTTANPTIQSQGLVNAASQRPEQAYAPGSYITIYGSALSDSTRAFFTPYLPLSLVGISADFYDQSRGISVPARLTYVSPTQVNIQIPWELQGSTTAQLRISKSQYSNVTIAIPIASASPAFFEYTESGTGQLLAAALDENNKLITSANPVQRGHVAQLYANGLGAVSNQPASGDPGPSSPLASTTTTPVVTIGGQNAVVQFSGLAPGFVGLYQLNVIVPPNSPTGIQPLVIKVGAVTGKTSQIPVK